MKSKNVWKSPLRLLHQPEKVDNKRVDVLAKFEEICQSLNLDEQAKKCAWDSYVDLSDKYGLEV